MTLSSIPSSQSIGDARRKRVATIADVALLIANIPTFLYGMSQSIPTLQQGRFPNRDDLDSRKGLS